MSQISGKNYLYFYLRSSPGYLVFNSTFSVSNVTCDLTLDYEYNDQSCSSTSKTEAIEGYCSESCHEAKKELAACITKNTNSNGDIVLKYWEGSCIKDPNDPSKICLLERLKMLKEKGLDETFLIKGGSGIISCDACTRLSMENMINNYDYLKSNPEYKGYMPSSSAIKVAEANIIKICGKPYDKLELETSGTNSVESNAGPFPTYAIVLLALGCFSALLGIMFCIFLRRRRHSVPFSECNESLTAKENTDTEYSSYYSRNNNYYVSEYVSEENAANTLQIKKNALLSRPQVNTNSYKSQDSGEGPKTNVYQQSNYDDMRVTYFNK
eukprot:NODE_576_length_6549_cov_0.390078.p3 type:complete len:326 gc:universal NODE_576_length_6549_cov_0.390078:1658-681(-)